MSAQFSYIILITLAISFFVLAYLSYVNNPKKRVNQVFSIWVVILATWSLVSFLEDEPLGNTLTNLLLKTDFSLGIIIGYLFLIFSFLFPRITVKPPKVVIYVLGIVSLMFSSMSFINLIVDGIHYKNGIQYNEGPLFIPYALLLASFFVVGCIILALKYRILRGVEKLQTIYFFYGISISAFFALLFNLVIANINYIPPQTSRFGVYGITFLVGATAYSIIKHRLLDIEVIIRRSVIYSVLLAILVGLYSLLVFGLNRIFLPGGTAGFPRITDLIAIVIVAFTVDPLKKFIEKSTDRVFFKARYNAEEQIGQLSETLASVIELPELVKEIKKVLKETIKVGKIAIYTKADSHYKPLAAADDFPKRLDLSIEKEYFLASYFTGNPEILVLDEIKRSVQEGKRLDPELAESTKFLGDNGVAVVVPLLAKGNLSGAMFLGEKLSQDIYSGEDIRFLEILAHQAALALENAKLYEEEKLYGIHLKQEVEKATANLRDANERLKELDELKDEFMSIASHELRTPMTAIKSYVWLALNNRGGEIGSQLRNYLTKVYDSSERMINMINDMLNVSRIETGRMQLEIVPTSTQKVLDQVVGDLSARASEARIEIKVAKDKIIPLVLADRDKLVEVFTNLIGNALKFTRKGGTVSVSSRKIGNVVETSVIDTGVGIAKENISKLFKKYGKLGESYATMSPTTGTGLGLYITKQYLEKMKGAIRVESTLGKGTTFTFSLPIATGAAKETEETKEVATFVPRRIIK